MPVVSRWTAILVTGMLLLLAGCSSQQAKAPPAAKGQEAAGSAKQARTPAPLIEVLNLPKEADDLWDTGVNVSGCKGWRLVPFVSRTPAVLGPNGQTFLQFATSYQAEKWHDIVMGRTYELGKEAETLGNIVLRWDPDGPAKGVFPVMPEFGVQSPSGEDRDPIVFRFGRDCDSGEAATIGPLKTQPDMPKYPNLKLRITLHFVVGAAKPGPTLPLKDYEQHPTIIQVGSQRFEARARYFAVRVDENMRNPEVTVTQNLGKIMKIYLAEEVSRIVGGKTIEELEKK